MVNKVVVGLLIGIILLAMMVGVFIGMLAGGGGGDVAGDEPSTVEPTPLPTDAAATAAPTGTVSTDVVETGVASTPSPTVNPTAAPATTLTAAPTSTATPTPAPTPTPTPTPAQTATPTPTPAPTPTPTPAEQPTIPPSEFDESETEREIRRVLNERREAAGLDPLGADGEIAETLQQMARNHSEAMANAGKRSHSIDGRSSAGRYEAYGLAETCKWDAGDHVVRSDSNELEAIEWTAAGREDFKNRYNPNETAIADTVVDYWWDNPRYGKRVSRPRANLVGVGTTITDSGDAYVTVNLCRN